MNVREIFDLVQSKYPHGYENPYMIELLNTIIREYMRTLFKPETVTAYDIVGGLAFYAIGFSPEKVVSVIVNDEKYEQSTFSPVSQSRFYYILDGNTIGLYPTPARAISYGLVVFHIREPKSLTVGDMNTEPDFDRDWQMLLVYRLCKELAEADQNASLINAYISQINGLENEIKRTKIHPRYEIMNVYGGII